MREVCLQKITQLLLSYSLKKWMGSKFMLL